MPSLVNPALLDGLDAPSAFRLARSEKRLNKEWLKECFSASMSPVAIRMKKDFDKNGFAFAIDWQLQGETLFFSSAEPLYKLFFDHFDRQEAWMQALMLVIVTSVKTPRELGRLAQTCKQLRWFLRRSLVGFPHPRKPLRLPQSVLSYNLLLCQGPNVHAGQERDILPSALATKLSVYEFMVPHQMDLSHLRKSANERLIAGYHLGPPEHILLQALDAAYFATFVDMADGHSFCAPFQRINMVIPPRVLAVEGDRTWKVVKCMFVPCMENWTGEFCMRALSYWVCSPSCPNRVRGPGVTNLFPVKSLHCCEETALSLPADVKVVDEHWQVLYTGNLLAIGKVSKSCARCKITKPCVPVTLVMRMTVLLGELTFGSVSSACRILNVKRDAFLVWHNKTWMPLRSFRVMHVKQTKCASPKKSAA